MVSAPALKVVLVMSCNATFARQLAPCVDMPFDPPECYFGLCHPGITAAVVVNPAAAWLPCAGVPVP